MASWLCEEESFRSVEYIRLSVLFFAFSKIGDVGAYGCSEGSITKGKGVIEQCSRMIWRNANISGICLG